MRVSGWLYLIGQTCCGVCLLTAVGLSAGLRRFSPLRILLTSAMLGLLTMAAASSALWLRMALAALTAAAPLLVWPDAPRSLHRRMAALTPFFSLWMTGLMRLLHPLALPGAALLMLGCTALLTMPRAIRRTAAAPEVASVQIRIGPRRMTLTALIDSGNLLRDVITGLPVIVISRQAAARLMPLPPDGTLLPGMRLMNVRTISGTALMTILRPDNLRLQIGRQWQDAQALIGLSPDGYEGFQALLPASLVAQAAADAPSPAISQGG